MSIPQVSVIIPAYNQAAFIDGAIQSVLGQTFTSWELIVVDDGSIDATLEVVGKYNDPRIHCVSQANRGLPGARNTGIAMARGQYLAFLDADDAYHAEKLKWHVEHLETEPEVGLSYASRVEVDGEGKPCWLLRAPRQVKLVNLVMGFPFTINELMVRRSWIDRAGTFDESFDLVSEDRDWYLRLALQGCTFGRLDRFVAYRRIHAHRVFSRFPERVAMMGRALETAFSDPRCPAEVKGLRDPAYAQIYLFWAIQGFVQGEPTAQGLLLEANRLDPRLFVQGKNTLLNSLVWFSVRDGSDHEEPLQMIFNRLPDSFEIPPADQEWAIARGYFFRAVRELLWEREETGGDFMQRARQLGLRLDKELMASLSDQFSKLQVYSGDEHAQAVFRKMTPYLEWVSSSRQITSIDAAWSINKAFTDYQHGVLNRVPSNVIRASVRRPAYLLNRGVLSMLSKSLFETLWQRRS